MTMIPDNLFAAAKGYTVAVRELRRSLDQAPAAELALHFLAGFAFELSLKAAIFSKHGDEAQLRRLGHDLHACLSAAKSDGYSIPAGFGIEEVIDAIAPSHAAFEYRYVADVEMIQTAPLGALLRALSEHIDTIENQFEVWTDTADPAQPSS